jgi:hypothetical protein
MVRHQGGTQVRYATIHYPWATPIVLVPIHSDRGYSVSIRDDRDNVELYATPWVSDLDVALYDARGELGPGECEVNVLEVEER